VRSSNITYNAAISACEKNRELQQALDLFVRMLGVRVQRDTITYNAAISACEKTFVGSRPWCSSKECRMKVRSETLSLTMPPAVLVRKASNGSMFLELFERMLGEKVQQHPLRQFEGLKAPRLSGRFRGLRPPRLLSRPLGRFQHDRSLLKVWKYAVGA
jgi:pentatricopeptide repeat protein